MNSNLFDKNGIEICVGDQYIVYTYDALYTVFWKGGAICGGIDYDNCIPLRWIGKPTFDGIDLGPMKLDWLTLLTTNEV